MTPHATPRRTVFSATTSWVGVLLLGAGLTQWAVPSSQATPPGPQSASIEFIAIDEALGVFQGGQQRDFVSGTYGWQEPAFESLGMMGIEWTTPTGSEARRDFSPDPGTASPSPGGNSSWTTPGYFSPNPDNQFFTEKTVSLSGNQVQFSMRHRSLGDESAINRRLLWVAQLAESYNPSYAGAGTSTLLITDTSGAHPTVIIQAHSSAGSPTFEGGTSIYTPLIAGDRSPTLYLIPGDAEDFTMEITVGIIDADPCSMGAASSFAASQAGNFGVVWDSMTSCAEEATWSITADDEPSGLLPLNFSAPYQAPVLPVTRSLEISGLPDGVTWERAEDDGNSLRVSLRASTAVGEGTYPVTWSTRERRDEAGITIESRRSTSTGTLTVVAAPPALSPEEPEAATPVIVQAEPPSPSPSSSPEVTRVAIEPDTPRPLLTRPAPTFEIPTILPAPPETPVIEPPSPLVDREPRTVSQTVSAIPEPLGAGVWLGVGTGLLAGGGIIAALRRRFSRENRESLPSGERID